MLAFIVFSVIFNGMQRGIEVYRNNSVLSLFCTSFIVLRSLIFGISSAELFLSGLLIVMLSYAYVLIVRIEKLKHRDRAREEELRAAHSDLEVHRNMLEELVRVRTSDLLKTNMNLMKEIKVRKQAEREARQKQTQLLQAAKMASLGSLVAGLAHEIGNPMALIQANLSILKKFVNASFPLLDQNFKDKPDSRMCNFRYFELKERMGEAIEGLDDGTKRVTRLVSDLRTYARQQPVVFSGYFLVEDAISKAFALTRNLIEKSTSNFSIEMEEDIPKVRGDLLKTEQVLINLITNACQALTAYDQPIKIRADVSLDLNHVNIEVVDKGRGMTKAVMEKIRDPFFTTRRHKDGTGLGLSISDSIIREHGGQLEFISEPGAGTTARIVLPLVAELTLSLPITICQMWMERGFWSSWLLNTRIFP